MSEKPIVIAADHAGLELKTALIADMAELGLKVMDLGVHRPERVDYPDYAEALAKVLAAGEAERGILICGSGIGISMAANRFAHIRAALCHDGLSARLARAHNDANVLVLGGRLIGPEQAKDCLREFLKTAFEGGRHAARIAKFSAPVKPVEGSL